MKDLMHREDLVRALKTYGIFYLQKSAYVFDNYTIHRSYYYVSSNTFSNKQFKQGIIDLLLLKGEEYSTHWSTQLYRNLFIICSTFRTLE